MNDPYKILGVSPSATDDEIKRAYHELARKYHPDKYTDSDLAELAEEKMKEVNAAYEQIQNMRIQSSSGGTGGYSSYQGSTSSSGSEVLAKIRWCINTGHIAQGDMMLEKISPEERNAEWKYLKAHILLRRGYYADALSLFDAACAEDPYNEEYRRERDRLKARAENFRGYSASSGTGCTDCDICTGICCADACCECLGGDLCACC